VMSAVGDGTLQGKVGERSLAIDSSGSATALWNGERIDRVWRRG